MRTSKQLKQCDYTTIDSELSGQTSEIHEVGKRAKAENTMWASGLNTSGQLKKQYDYTTIDSDLSGQMCEIHGWARSQKLEIQCLAIAENTCGDGRKLEIHVGQVCENTSGVSGRKLEIEWGQKL